MRKKRFSGDQTRVDIGNRGEKSGEMEPEYISKTRKKKEAHGLQQLGEQLVALNPGQLEAMDLPEELLEAVQAAQKIKRHGARRRQMQYIGALMRQVDPQPIESALQRIRFNF